MFGKKKSHHQPPHSLLFDALILLLLLPLGVGVIGSHSLGGLLDLGCDGAVVFFKVLGMLQDAVEVFLSGERHKPILWFIKIHHDRHQT